MGDQLTEDLRFPFGAEFQRQLLRLLVEDSASSEVLAGHIEPHYFEDPALSWAWRYCRDHAEKFGAFPSLGVLLHEARGAVPPEEWAAYEMTLLQVREEGVRDEAWLKEEVIDFVRRNVFTRAFHECRGLYNDGKAPEAYDLMMVRLEELQRAVWEVRDQSFFFEDFSKREIRRTLHDYDQDAIPSGFPWLDKVLDGGLSIGDFGIWVAYAKIGKTALLVNLGKAATSVAMRHTAHFVFEDTKQKVETRYDSCFLDELYNRVKRGLGDLEKYERVRRTYALLRGRLVVRGFTDGWDYTILDIDRALKELKKVHGWTPELIIVDYGDLLGGREKHYRSEHAKQKAAFQDLKTLAKRGYALWTASQAQRPKEGAEDKAHLLMARSISDCWDKVKIADFVGSINQTRAEKGQRIMRLYAEMYRDNAADVVGTVRADLAKMQIRHEDGLVSVDAPTVGTTPALGYKPRQQTAPI